MHDAFLCSTNDKITPRKGRNSEAYSNLLPCISFNVSVQAFVLYVFPKKEKHLQGKTRSSIVPLGSIPSLTKNGERPHKLKDYIEVQTNGGTTIWSWLRCKAEVPTPRFVQKLRLKISSRELPKLTQLIIGGSINRVTKKQSKT